MPETERVASSPIHRLSNFLLASTAVEKKANISGKHFIAQYIDADPKDAIEIYAGFLMILNLAKRSKIALEASASNIKAPCLSALERISSRLGAANLDRSWNEVIKSIPAGDRDLLKIGESILEQETYELVLFDHEVSGFEASVDDILEEVKTSKLPAEVKTTISDLLADVSRGLENYDRYGLDGLKDALATAYGKVLLESAKITPHKKESSLVKLWTFFKDINAAISMVGHASSAGKIATDAIDRIFGS